MKRKTEVLIIGAGISGCAAAQELQANNIDYLLVEKNVEPGGLTRSISLGNAHFDYSGHYLHLARFKSPEGIPYAKQNSKDWQLIKRKSVVYIEGTIVPAAFQYNLFALPEKTKSHCINDFRNRPIIDTPNSFRKYLVSGFGQGMCDTFLFPYNEKMQAIDLNDLSVDGVKRFFPVPDELKIERGYSKSQSNEAVGYNSSFWYPKKNGIGKLAKGLAEGLDSLLTCYPVEKIDLDAKVAYTPQGEIHYNKVITSIPLKEFCNYCVMAELQQLSSSLIHNKVLCINILVKGSFNKDFQGCQWIYVPDKTIPFYRVGIYSNLPYSTTPANHTSIYVEVAKSNQESISITNDILNNVFYSLEKLGWVNSKDCLAYTASWIECAYVHFDHKRLKTVKKITEILKNYDIYLIGRYGLWDYISMEDSILSGIETSKMILS